MNIGRSIGETLVVILLAGPSGCTDRIVGCPQDRDLRDGGCYLHDALTLDAMPTCRDRADPIDPAGEDTNCDGVDGIASNTVFVSTNNGLDTNDCLTALTACQTIARGMSAGCLAHPHRTTVMVESGTYDESISLDVCTTSIVGSYVLGFSAARMIAPQPTTIIRSTHFALTIAMPNVPILVSGLILDGNPPDETSGSAIAVRVRDATDVRFNSVVIRAINARAGADGAIGMLGPSGVSGSLGNPAYLRDSSTCGGAMARTTAPPDPPAGAPANASCAMELNVGGGAGGTSGFFSGAANDHTPGGTGIAAGPDAPGGMGGASDYVADSMIPSVGLRGTDGAAGSIGSPGEPALNSIVNVTFDGFDPTSGRGDDGANGTPGNGGGGGGGGGFMNSTCYYDGGSGGSGGSGGCGGTGGLGGTSGGASIGIISISATLSFIDSSIVVSDGGNGGAGGVGGPGGVGGLGGSGGRAAPSRLEGMAGGSGGNGGSGGAGGPGAGGNGGPSWCGVLLSGARFDPLHLPQCDHRGRGGMGGLTPAGGHRGLDGALADFVTL